MPSTTTFTLTAAEQAEINKPVVGNGGHQTLMRTLHSKLNPATGEIILSDGLIGRIVRYSLYGPGGFQNRFKDAFRRSLRDAMT